jgi:hypothetical protein
MNGAAFVHDDDMMDAIVHSLPKGTKPAAFHRRKPASASPQSPLLLPFLNLFFRDKSKRVKIESGSALPCSTTLERTGPATVLPRTGWLRPARALPSPWALSRTAPLRLLPLLHQVQICFAPRLQPGSCLLCRARAGATAARRPPSSHRPGQLAPRGPSGTRGARGRSALSWRPFRTPAPRCRPH